jgi:glycosyltransferase involved in cell wall biosynthesis
VIEIDKSVLPILTIAIPTWNRDEYLRQNLRQLKSEIDTVGHHLVEVLVSDNCSPDSTPDVVREAQATGLAVRYVRNERNLGWARNFAQCVDLAKGKYLILFGDDDVLCSGTLSLLIPHLSKEYGVICLRPYGYDVDFEKENPGGRGKLQIFKDPCAYLVKISKCFTLTSALVINRTLLNNVDSREFIHTNLATFHLVLRAALAARSNLYIDSFLVAGKRQNSSSYVYYKVFVEEFWDIVDAHVIHGFNSKAVRRLEQSRLFTYYPFYMQDLRTSGCGDLEATFQALKRRFGKRILFWIWIAPTLRLPKPLGIAWGSITMTIGRIANGDFRRGIMFLRSRIFWFK